RDLLHDRGVVVPTGKERASGTVMLKVGKRPVPIYISAEGPRTLRVAGRVCDGVILGTGFDLDVLEWAEARIAEGAREAGRNTADVDIMPAGMIYVDDEGDLARTRVRSCMDNRAHLQLRFTYAPILAEVYTSVRKCMYCIV